MMLMPDGFNDYGEDVLLVKMVLCKLFRLNCCQIVE